MKFKSGTITQASGSFGGITASHNAGGMYFRARAIPTNPNTTFQATRRMVLAQLVNRWQNELSAAQRAAWNVYAANVSTIDKLGSAIFISGINWYIGCNAARPLSALAYVDTAPTIFNTGGGTPPTAGAVTAPSTLSLIFGATDGWVSETGSALQIYASRPQNAGIGFFRGPYQFAGSVKGDTTTPPTSPATVTLPFVYTAGQKAFFRGRILRADGRRSVNLTIVSTVS